VCLFDAPLHTLPREGVFLAAHARPEVEVTARGMCGGVVGPAALLALLALAACGPARIAGEWTGRDEENEPVAYTFGPAGTGSRSIGALQEPMTYRVREGYPTLIEIVVGDAESVGIRRGIVQVLWDGRMRLELGDPDGPAPPQLSRGALVLRRPATR
jgi:hypothetical protein